MDMTALYEEIKLKLQEIGLKVDEAQAGLEIEKQASYQMGYADGKASVVCLMLALAKSSSLKKTWTA
jgi:hypothetical protein